MRTPDRSRRITVGIASLGRGAATVRCLCSLTRIEEIIERIIVVDDGSNPPLAPEILAAPLPTFISERLEIIRLDRTIGIAAARNICLARARTRYLLNLDDDAAILDASTIHAALDVLDGDARVAVVAFPGADALDAELTSPAADGARQVASFVGFAFLVRCATALAVGGFREILEINGEERELSLRLLDAGYSVIELPNALVAHVRVAGAPDVRRYLYLTVRNGALNALYNLPFPLNVISTIQRLSAYFSHRRGLGVEDPGGFGRILRGVWAAWPPSTARKPVRWSTLRRWRRLVREKPAYEAAS